MSQKEVKYLHFATPTLHNNAPIIKKILKTSLTFV